MTIVLYQTIYINFNTENTLFIYTSTQFLIYIYLKSLTIFVGLTFEGIIQTFQIPSILFANSFLNLA